MDKLATPNRGLIGLYRPGMTSPERLEKTTIGREEMLSDLLGKLSASAGKKTHQHFVFIGPRGVGKTHFLSLLRHRIASSPELQAKFTIVQFAEETHRLLSFADFLLRICEILAQSEDGGVWSKLFAATAEEEDDQRIIDILEPILNRYRQDSGRILLLLLENLDEIFSRQIKSSQDIHRMRKFLMTTPSCILVATSPITFSGLTDIKEPFFDFFDTQTLDTLTQQQTLDAIRANLGYDGRDDLLARFDELSPKIKALHKLTGGNPRLVMMHYALIADENVLEVKQQFEKLLDQISPFYQDRVKDLPPQERAVLETMALIRTERKTPALIAKKLRMSPSQTSSLLKRLTKSGYLVVMDHPDDRRSKIYRIKEGFFDLWLSMNESRKQRKRLPALTEFFEFWYQREEREQKRRKLVDDLLAEKTSSANVERPLAALGYLSDAGPDDERIAAKVQAAALLHQIGREKDVTDYVDEVKLMKPGGVMQWLTLHDELWANIRWQDPISQVEEMIACWELQRAGDFEEFVARLIKLGESMQDRGLHKALADLLISASCELEDSDTKIPLLLQAAQSQKMMGDLQIAIKTLQDALRLAINTNNRSLEGTTLNNLSQIYDACGDYDHALDHLEHALAIRREIGDQLGEGTTLNNIASISHARGDYDRALRYLEQALAISREIGNRHGEGTTLNNISQIYKVHGDYDRALDYLEESLAIRREIDDRSGEGATLNNIASISHARGDYDRALEYLEQALAISREIGNRSGEGTTLNNISQIFDSRGDYDRALEYLEQSLAIEREIGDRSGESTTLNNISQIYKARGDYDPALEHLEQALVIEREIGNRSGEGHTLNNISQIFDSRGDYDRALEYLEQSLAIEREIGDRAGMCPALFNMGSIQLQKEDIDGAIESFLEAYKIAKELGLKEGLDALKVLGKQLGHEEGLDFWEMLLGKDEGELVNFNER